MLNYDKHTDQELVALLNQGEVAAYDQLFRTFYEPLCFFAEKIVGDSFKAEDLAQDALIKLWQKKQDFDTFESLRSFLYVCVRNSAFNELEKIKVRNKYQELMVQAGATYETTVLDAMMQAEVVRKLFYAVDTLPEQCRRVIRMTFDEGMTPKEIAAELGVTVSTVNNQKMRGLILLRQRISGEDLNMAVAILFPGAALFLR